MGEVFGEVLKEQKFPKLWYVYDSFKIMVGDGLVTSKGETWKRQRRLLTPLFHFQKLKQMPDIMNQRIEHLCEKLEGFKGKEVLAVDLFGEMTLEVVIDCVFGGKRYLDAEAMEPLWKSVNVAVNNYFIGDLILGSTLNTITPFPWNFKIKSCMKQIRAMVKRAIDLKREELKNGEQDSDLLASLIQVKDETTGEGIPESLIIDESLTFLFAGHDTTSSLLSWCMSLLAHHPEVVSKIREEISTVLGDRQAKYEDLKNLPYCDNVLKETLRMRPPVPLLDRAVGEDCEVNGQTYKKGTYVYPVFIAAHFDNRYWKKPFEFRPERFSKDNKDEPKPSPFALVPFSAGSRNCIGKKFAIIEATLALVAIIRRFDVHSKLSDDELIWQFEGTVKPINFKCSFTPIK